MTPYEQELSDFFFPPDESELKEIIEELKKKLEDERYSEKWKSIAKILQEKEQQLQELIIKNNAL